MLHKKEVLELITELDKLYDTNAAEHNIEGLNSLQVLTLSNYNLLTIDNALVTDNSDANIVMQCFAKALDNVKLYRSEDVIIKHITNKSLELIALHNTKPEAMLYF